ncbi:MAG: DUF2399 domain-containing protein [Ruminococcus sp.]|nr:DUF2399 domain-containing protein [Ruminococcus sp.]
MHDAKSIAEILKRDKRYIRIMEQLKSKYSSYGESRGKVSIKDATREECDAAAELICPKVGYEPPELSFSVKAFENGLRQFGDVSLKEVLESYYGMTMQTNAEQAAEKTEKKKDLENRLLSLYNGKPCSKWLRTLFSSKAYGYKTVMAQYGADPDEAEKLICSICDAINPRYVNDFEPIGLPVLSAEITGNPHYFDQKGTAGKLLISALGFLSEKTGTNSEAVKEIYSYFGIEPDSITSACAMLGVRLFNDSGDEHGAFKVFADNGEISMLSAANLTNIHSADCDKKTVFAIENPAVFIALVPIVKQKGFAMICTSGQLKMCVIKLLDMLAKSECNIYYAGDFDPEGLQIADKLISRYKEYIHIWRMSIDDYLMIDKTEPISESRIKKLDKLNNEELRRLGEIIRKEGKAGYQELLIYEMAEDISSL